MCRNQTVPYLQTSFQETVSRMSYIQTPHISKHPFDGSGRLRSVVPSFRSVIPSFPHFAIVYIPTIQKLSPFQQTVFSQTWFRQITQSAIHQNQQSIKISNPSKNQHSTIPLFQKRCWRSDIIARIQRYRVIQYVTVTNHPCNGHQ